MRHSLPHPRYVLQTEIMIDTRCPMIYWNVIEAGTGVIGACLPTLKPLVSSLDTAATFNRLEVRLRNSLSRTRLTERQHFTTRPSSSDDDSMAIALYGGTSRKGHNPHTSIEAVHLPDVSSPSDRIVVTSSFTQQEVMA